MGIVILNRLLLPPFLPVVQNKEKYNQYNKEEIILHLHIHLHNQTNFVNEIYKQKY